METRIALSFHSWSRTQKMRPEALRISLPRRRQVNGDMQLLFHNFQDGEGR